MGEYGGLACSGRLRSALPFQLDPDAIAREKGHISQVGPVIVDIACSPNDIPPTLEVALATRILHRLEFVVTACGAGDGCLSPIACSPLPFAHGYRLRAVVRAAIVRCRRTTRMQTCELYIRCPWLT